MCFKKKTKIAPEITDDELYALAHSEKPKHNPPLLTDEYLKHLEEEKLRKRTLKDYIDRHRGE